MSEVLTPVESILPGEVEYDNAPPTETELEHSGPMEPHSSMVCMLCKAVAVCQTKEPDGGLLCHEHAGQVRIEGKDLFCIDSDVPFEFVPHEQGEPFDASYTITDEDRQEHKPYSDPEDATDPERPAPFDTPDALAAYDAETVRLVNNEAEEVAHFERAYDEANDVAKECKKAFEKSQAALRELIEDRRKGRGKPKQPTLFNDPQPEPLDPEDEDDSEIEPTDAAEQNDAQASVDANYSPPESEATGSGVWQGNHEFTPDELAMPLSSLQLPQGVLNKLADPTAKDGGSIRPITTVGEYFEYLKPLANGFQPYLKNIKGLGDTAVEKIEQAIFDFTEQCCQRKQREQKRAA